MRRPRIPMLVAFAGLVCQWIATVEGVRIVQSNDDGWAELYVRSAHDAIRAAGHDIILSAPADNKSGTGSRDAEPEPRTEPCEYDSCVADDRPYGQNESEPNADLYWVNSFPVTSMRFGIDRFAKKHWDDEEGDLVELAVSGPNVGPNVWLSVPFSGTVGAAVFAAHDRAVPAIAFSGASHGNLPWDTQPVPSRSVIYGDLAASLVDRVVESGKPFLPDDTWLNVNFQSFTDERCQNASDFRWILTRINPGFLSPPDVDQCGSKRLPNEADVILRRSDGCYATISVGDAKDKTTATAERQEIVRDKLGDFLSCLPAQKKALAPNTNIVRQKFWV